MGSKIDPKIDQKTKRPPRAAQDACMHAWLPREVPRGPKRPQELQKRPPGHKKAQRKTEILSCQHIVAAVVHGLAWSNSFGPKSFKKGPQDTKKQRKTEILSCQHTVAAVVHGAAWSNSFGAFRSLAAQVSESVFLWAVSLDGGVTVRSGGRGEPSKLSSAHLS